MNDSINLAPTIRRSAEVYFTYKNKTTKISKKALIQKVRQMNFADYFAWYVQTEKEGNISDRTLEKYLITITSLKEIVPTMLLVDMENNRQNMQYIIDKYGATHERKTVIGFRGKLNTALSFAVDDGYIRGFATNGIIIRSVEDTWSPEKKAEKEQKIKSFNASEFNKFKSYVDFTLDRILNEKPIYKNYGANSYQTSFMLFSVLIHSGLRFAEALGFKFSDIEPGFINIDKSWNHRTPEGGFIPTKTTGSIRKVAIDDTLYDLLLRYNNYKNKNGLSNDKDRPLINEGARIFNSVLNSQLSDIEKKLKIPTLTMHKLRHSYASFLLYQDVSPQIVARQLGHENTNMLFKVYAHILDEKKRMADAKIRSLLS